jgi:hypothetical protein
MKLSCGKCQTLREFSGDPLKCEVCGWVCGSAPSEDILKRQQKAQSQQELGKVLGWAGLIFVGIIAGIYWLTPEEQKLADEYHVPKASVVIESKPHGCDFDDAPLGNKHCHYDKVVLPERACGAPNCGVKSVYVSWRKVEE